MWWKWTVAYINLFVLFENGADVVVGVEADHDGVVGRNARRDDGKHGGADQPGARYREPLLELEREEDGIDALDGKGENQAGRVVGEQVAEVLLEDAEELAPVDQVERRVGEVPAPRGSQQATEQDADQVEGVRHGQSQ